jgi:gliding motility-associated-like protein
MIVMRVKIYSIILSGIIILGANYLFAQGDIPGEISIVSIGQNQTINCTSDPVAIGVSVSNWVEGFQYEWNTGETDSVIFVKQNSTENYILQITNEVRDIHTLRAFTVKVFNEPVKFVSTDLNIDKFTCPGTTQTVGVQAVSGHGPYTYLWDNGSVQSQIQIEPLSSQTFNVRVTDACGSHADQTVRINVAPHDPIFAPFTSIIEFDCENDVIQVEPDLSNITGGVGYGYAFTFSDWDDSKNIGKVVDASNHAIFNAQVSDACGTQFKETQIELVQKPIELPAAEAKIACLGDQVEITDSESYRFYFWDGHEMNTKYTVSVTESSSYNLTYLDQCGTKHTVKREIEMASPNAEFEYDAHGDLGSVDFEANADENLIEYSWFSGGELLGQGPELSADFESGSSNEVELIVTDLNGCKASTTRLVSVRDNVSIPSAFSPNGDGRNDVFQIEMDEELASFSIKIFDRWGQLIYESNDQYFAWEGDSSIKGMLNTYVCKISGVSLSGKRFDKTSTLTIVN